MVFRTNRWGWKATAARLLVAPVLAAVGAATNANAQYPPPKSASPTVVKATAPKSATRTADPKLLLKQGRDALKAGQFDQAIAFANQADANNSGGRWGLFDDTPDSLKKDVQAAQAKANKAKAEQLTKQARTIFDQASRARTDADKLAQMDRAYDLASQAVTLGGSSDFLDDINPFGGERADKLKKEIDAARMPLRKKVTPAQMAKTAMPAPTMPTSTPSKFAPGTPTSRPSMPSPSMPAPSMPSSSQTASKPTVTSSSSQSALTSPAKLAAIRIVGDGRGLLRQGQFSEARMKAMEAQALNVPFALTEDSPEALMRDVLAEGKKKVDALTSQARGKAATKDFTGAEEDLGTARTIAFDLGFQTRPIDEQHTALRQMIASANKPVMPPPTIPTPSVPTPSVPMTAEHVASKTPANPVVTAGPVVPAIPTPVVPVASTTPVVPAIEAPVVPTIPATPMTVPVVKTPEPTTPVMPAPIVPLTPEKPEATATLPTPVVPTTTPAPAKTDAANGKMMLDQATKELTRGDLMTAEKLAIQVHNGDYGMKKEAQEVLREISAERTARKRKDASAAFKNAVELHTAKQHTQALGVFKLLDPADLSPEQKLKLPELMASCSEEIAKLQKPVTPVAGTDEPKKPTPSTGGLTDQAKAMADVEFQKFRAEALDAESKARAAFDRGETDLAIQMLADFSARVKGSSLSAGRQNMLMGPIERRLEGFRIMKRQMDFYTKEARDKKDAKERLASRSVAEQNRKEEIAKKVREVNDLIKGHHYPEAEKLALQLKTLEPNDPALEAVYELAKRQRRVDDYAKIKDSKEKFVLDGLNASEKTGLFVDVDDPVRVNVARSIKAMGRGDGSELYVRPRTAAEREIENKLDTTFSVEFQNKPLRDVIQALREKTKLNITTDDASLADEQVSLETPITETMNNVALRSILSILLDKARLKYVVENDVIRVTTEKKAKGRLHTKVFSVMDLVTPIPDFALATHQSLGKTLDKVSGPQLPWQALSGASSGGGLPNGQMVSGQPGIAGPNGVFNPTGATLENNPANSPLSPSMHLAPARQNTSAQLMKLITGMVRPYSWQEMGGPGKLDYYDIGGALVVNQTADVINDVAQLLESLRRLQDLSVAVEVRLISLSESFFERVGVDFQANIQTNRTGRDGSFFERALTTGSFRPEPFTNSISGVDNTVVGWNPQAGGFTPDLNFPIRPNSFGLGIPPFGGYQGPTSSGGLSLGLAFLNDIQVYLFLEAAQGDRRVQVMQAPKITLFNGQTSTVTVSDITFFTLGLQVFNVGGQFVYLPQNTPTPSGVSLTVQAVVSADRRFVRMNMAPNLTEITSAIVPLFPVTAFITPVFEGGSQGVPIPFTQFFQQPSFQTISVQTTVAVPDGGTVVMGGLKTLSEGRNEFGPPVLSNIPYLNRLFRNQGMGRETRHIMIMVTPRIVINREEELTQTGVGDSNLLPPPAAAP